MWNLGSGKLLWRCWPIDKPAKMARAVNLHHSAADYWNPGNGAAPLRVCGHSYTTRSNPRQNNGGNGTHNQTPTICLLREPESNLAPLIHIIVHRASALMACDHCSSESHVTRCKACPRHCSTVREPGHRRNSNACPNLQCTRCNATARENRPCPACNSGTHVS